MSRQLSALADLRLASNGITLEGVVRFFSNSSTGSNGLEGTGHLVVFLSFRGVDGISVDRDRRGSNGQIAIVETGMRRPAGMPELEKDRAPGFVNAIDHRAPPLDHLVGVDSGRFIPPVGLVGNGGRFGDDESGAGPLRIVFRHDLVGDSLLSSASPGHGREDDAVLQGKVVKFEGSEKVGR